MMGRSCFLRILLVSVLVLSLSSFSHGFGRKVMETVQYEDSSGPVEATAGISRMMIELMDYGEPEPNTNPKTGFLFSPPPQQS